MRNWLAELESDECTDTESTISTESSITLDSVDCVDIAYREYAQNGPALRKMHVHKVLVILRDVKPYRSGDLLHFRGKPTAEQQSLIDEYRDDLLEALRPRGLTKDESEILALYLDDIGEHDKTERGYAFNIAERSPVDRITLLRLAAGSPDYQG